MIGDCIVLFCIFYSALIATCGDYLVAHSLTSLHFQATLDHKRIAQVTGGDLSANSAV